MLSVSSRIKQLLSVEQRRILIYYGLIVLVFFGIFLRPNYATDTYADVMASSGHILENFLRGGRLITALGYAFFKILHIDVRIVCTMSFMLAIVCLVFALYILEELFYREVTHKRLWAFILPILIIINPFSIELFLYIEKGIMFLGVLLCVIAVYKFTSYLSSRRPADVVQSIILAVLATFCYQGIIGLFIILATVFVIAKTADWRQFVKNTLMSVLVYAIGPLTNLIAIKIFSEGGRTDGVINLGESLAKISAGAVDMFNMFRIIPSLCYWGVAAVAILLLVVCICRARRPLFNPKNLLLLLSIVYIFVVSCLAALAPQAVQQTASIWVVARSTYSFGATVGVILALIVFYQPKVILRKSWQYPMVSIILIFLMVQFMRFNTIAIDHYASIAIDRTRAQQIMQIIESYESEHQIEIASIAPARDGNMTYMYPGIFASGDINITAFSTEWSDVASISYWNHRYFERVKPDDAWSEYCNQHDWQSFSPEQINFVDGVLQLCLY